MTSENSQWLQEVKYHFHPPDECLLIEVWSDFSGSQAPGHGSKLNPNSSWCLGELVPGVNMETEGCLHTSPPWFRYASLVGTDRSFTVRSY
jgi:hypothetical protein